ncbi:MAG: BCCT family transporter, partial [Proteobacteria bacterium]|nr:BCCT family transporter [Pseudomonadota bacterium]
WGLHAWGIYALTGLAIAYFSFNHNQPLSIRGIFRPLLGDRVDGIYGHIIDVIASVATLLGVATSLGLGVSQINAGLNHLFEIKQSSDNQILLITGITFIATASVVLGINRGILNLSKFNMLVAAGLLLYVIVIGPTLFILNGFVENIGLYLNDFFYLAFWNETYSQGKWQNSWTVFYWGWWIAWAPFVGMFIARISRGRTVREFIAGVLFVATLLTFIWLSVFGDSALYIQLNHHGDLAAAVQSDLANALFVFLEMLPAAGGLPGLSTHITIFIGLLATIVIVSFFVTSSDSGSLVIDIITAGGQRNPPVSQRIFWAITEGVVAAILLLGGGLGALQTAAICAGLPLSILILCMILNLNHAMKKEHAPVNKDLPYDPEL